MDEVLLFVFLCLYCNLIVMKWTCYSSPTDGTDPCRVSVLHAVLGAPGPLEPSRLSLHVAEYRRTVYDDSRYLHLQHWVSEITSLIYLTLLFGTSWDWLLCSDYIAMYTLKLHVLWWIHLP